MYVEGLCLPFWRLCLDGSVHGLRLLVKPISETSSGSLYSRNRMFTLCQCRLSVQMGRCREGVFVFQYRYVSVHVVHANSFLVFILRNCTDAVSSVAGLQLALLRV